MGKTERPLPPYRKPPRPRNAGQRRWNQGPCLISEQEKELYKRQRDEAISREYYARRTRNEQQ